MRHTKSSLQTVRHLPALVNLICQNWKELCAEIQNCPLLGQEKMDAVAADYDGVDDAGYAMPDRSVGYDHEMLDNSVPLGV